MSYSRGLEAPVLQPHADVSFWGPQRPDYPYSLTGQDASWHVQYSSSSLEKMCFKAHLDMPKQPGSIHIQA